MMNAHKLFVTIGLSLAATSAQAAGFRLVDVPADAGGPALQGAIWYPCSEPPGEVTVGKITLPATKDCPLRGDKLPLIVVSHGRGGSFVGHHDTDEMLADAGFVVAAINHPGDTTADLSRSGDLSVFIERPTDIKRLIDFMVGASPVAANIDASRIGFFGFSRGGYTGLVLVGGNPDWASATDLCQQLKIPLCEKILRKEYPTTPLAHDIRIKAAVIADPLAVLFTAASLASIQVPIQLWASERGGDGVELREVAAVNQALPAKHEYRVVSSAGHFAFLSPCPAASVTALPMLCADAPGFDRVAFHQQFDRDVLAFFKTHLDSGTR
jgi:predicted dienelactone hydrolase